MARVQADLSKQRYGLGGPRHFYEDQLRQCRRCLAHFTFAGEEQRYWYEVRCFPLESVPVECVQCRKFYQRVRQAGRRLERLIGPSATGTPESWCEAALLLAHLGRAERARELYQRGFHLLGEGRESSNAKQLTRSHFEAAIRAPDLVDRTVPDIRDDALLLFSLFRVVDEAVGAHAGEPPLVARGALERIRFEGNSRPGLVLTEAEGPPAPALAHERSRLLIALELLAPMDPQRKRSSAPARPSPDDTLLLRTLRELSTEPVTVSERRLTHYLPIAQTPWGGYLLAAPAP